MSHIENGLFRRVDLQGSRVGPDIVIFDDRVGKYFASGPVGADIWDMLGEAISVEAICVRLLAMYEIDETTCQNEVDTFLSELRNLNLVEAVKGTATPQT